jgi:predicted TIM-barrel fold metal-dependent hydrolase
MGIKLDYTRPIYLDSLAADFTAMTIIGAHPSWPWHEEMIAAMLHKTNIFNDLSGWSPKYIPESLLREAATRLQDRFLFGSDYPFITPQRWLEDFEAVKIEFKPEVRKKLLWKNGQKLLANTAVGKMHFSS